jgi:hypothetical protein
MIGDCARDHLCEPEERDTHEGRAQYSLGPPLLGRVGPGPSLITWLLDGAKDDAR